MAIDRWEPYRDMISLRDAVNTLFQDSVVRPSTLLATNGGQMLTVPLDVRETPEAFIVEASVPGIKPEDVQITIHGDTLTIQGEVQGEQERQGETWHVRERRRGAFRRTISLNVPVDADKAAANHENGVLTLTLPKAESARPKQIKVGASGAAK